MERVRDSKRRTVLALRQPARECGRSRSHFADGDFAVSGFFSGFTVSATGINGLPFFGK